MTKSVTDPYLARRFLSTSLSHDEPRQFPLQDQQSYSASVREAVFEPDRYVFLLTKRLPGDGFEALRVLSKNTQGPLKELVVSHTRVSGLFNA